MGNIVFRDRRHAGRVLAQALAAYADRHDVIVLALPRGGVPVGYEVAAALHAPLDVFAVRKLGVPGREDGLATGSSMQAAIEALRPQRPGRIVVAVPTAAADSCERLRGLADEVVCANTPEPFRAVGAWYDDFSQTRDEEVRELLQRAALAREESESFRGVGVLLMGRRAAP
jgi:predicted phosphoribosyltransferase